MQLKSEKKKDFDSRQKCESRRNRSSSVQQRKREIGAFSREAPTKVETIRSGPLVKLAHPAPRISCPSFFPEGKLPAHYWISSVIAQEQRRQSQAPHFYSSKRRVPITKNIVVIAHNATPYRYLLGHELSVKVVGQVCVLLDRLVTSLTPR